MFPRPHAQKFHLTIAGTHNLSSAQRDAYSLSTIANRFGMQSSIAIDSTKGMETIQHRISNNFPITYLNSIESITQLFEKFKRLAEPLDLLISISAHGYRGESGNYFYFGGRKVDRHIMREWFRGLETSQNKILILIDTCHSENMVGFQQICDRTDCSQPTALAGCRLSQSLMEDLSDEFGYGGGLTCAFLDVVGSARSINLASAIQSCRLRVARLGVSTVLSCATFRVADIETEISDFITAVLSEDLI